MNNTENVHNRFLAKYDAVRDLINYLLFVNEKFNKVGLVNREFCEEFSKDLGRRALAIETSFMNYENCATPNIVEHYKVSSREEIITVFNRYQIHVCSNNILDDIENTFREVQICKEKLTGSRGFSTFLKNNSSINSELQDTHYDRWGATKHTKMNTKNAGNTGNAKKVEQTDEQTDDFVSDHEIDSCDLDDDLLPEEIDVETFLLELHNSDTHPSKNVLEFVTVKNNIVARLDFEETCNRITAFFNEQRINFVNNKPNPDLCKNCGELMIMYTEDAELRCDECGLILLLQGTVYDDSQPDSQSLQGTKNKRYDPKRHCDKRLNQIQAKEDWKIPDDVINKLDIRAQREYRHGKNLRSMKPMPCKQIRRWLKQEKMTKYNHHAPLIRKIITSMHGPSVIPPQLTMDEEQEVLIDFSTAMSCYETVTQTEEYKRKYEKDRNRVRQRNKPNRFYYWFVLFKILSQKLRGDPRLPRILECIHLQSSATLAKDDDIWAMMCQCEEMDGYVAEPTDRSLARLVI